MVKNPANLAVSFFYQIGDSVLASLHLILHDLAYIGQGKICIDCYKGNARIAAFNGGFTNLVFKNRAEQDNPIHPSFYKVIHLADKLTLYICNVTQDGVCLPLF